MFLEAGDWDYKKHELSESRPKVLFSVVPPIHFEPKKIENFVKYPCYTCPMYKTSDRRGVLSTTGHSTNFVMDVRIPSSKCEAHWVKRGTAMLTSLDD
jgi:dynein heavy chain, axonemal